MNRKKTEKKNKVASKYLHFLLPMFDILFVFMFFSCLEVTEKYLGKNENIFAKMTGSPLEEQVCVYYHNSLCVKSDVLIPSVCPHAVLIHIFLPCELKLQALCYKKQHTGQWKPIKEDLAVSHIQKKEWCLFKTHSTSQSRTTKTNV